MQRASASDKYHFYIFNMFKDYISFSYNLHPDLQGIMIIGWRPNYSLQPLHVKNIYLMSRESNSIRHCCLEIVREHIHSLREIVSSCSSNIGTCYFLLYSYTIFPLFCSFFLYIVGLLIDGFFNQSINLFKGQFVLYTLKNKRVNQHLKGPRSDSVFIVSYIYHIIPLELTF